MHSTLECLLSTTLVNLNDEENTVETVDNISTMLVSANWDGTLEHLKTLKLINELRQNEIAKNGVENALMNPIMQYFSYDHLPPHLREMSKQICELAQSLNDNVPDSAEKSAGLRKLLEAKDCFVRAIIPTKQDMPG